MVKKIVALGHSHLNAVRDGARLVDGFDGGSFELEFLQIHAIHQGSTMKGPPPFEMDQNLEEAIRASFQRCDVLLMLAYGNQHNRLGLVNHPRLFDFFLSEDRSLLVDNAREIIPEEFVKSQLRAKTAKLERFLGKVRKMAPEGLPIFQVECPAPIPSEAHIIKYAGHFEDKISEFGVTPSHLRYKLWRLFCQLTQEYCSANKIEYVPLPELVMDDSGFLREEFWQVDPSHGNTRFGKVIMEDFVYNVLNLENAQ